MRVLAFLKPEETVIVTDKVTIKQTSVVHDVINISGLNTLRGENNEKFGPRFPDLS